MALVSISNTGWLAACKLFTFNGIVFAGVRCAIVIMRIDGNDDEPESGKRDALMLECQPIAIPVENHRRVHH